MQERGRTLVPAPQHIGMLPGEVFHDLASGIGGADVVICLRLQKERMQEGMLSSVNEYARLYQINRETLRFAKSDCLVMHPGPINRGVEIDDASADSDRSAITSQIENGIFVRMASLHWVFSSDDRPKPPPKKTMKKKEVKVK